MKERPLQMLQFEGEARGGVGRAEAPEQRVVTASGAHGLARPMGEQRKAHARVVGLNSHLDEGEIDWYDHTRRKEKFLIAQLAIARDAGLPVLVHTPHRDKMQGFRRILEILHGEEFPMEMVLMDHGNEETIKVTRDTGCWQGFSIYPNTKMVPQRMTDIVLEYGVERMIINSAADWGVSDPLMVPRTIVKMQQARIPRERIEELVWGNPTTFFAQSGRLDVDELEHPASANLRETFDGNSVLRGQDPDQF